MKRKSKLFTGILCASVLFGLSIFMLCIPRAEAAGSGSVSITLTEYYDKAYEVLDQVNAERSAAGLSKLTMDQDLLEAAMLRAAEISVSFSHTRPNNQTCFTASAKMNGENIAYSYNTASSVMDGWMNSTGHRENILSSSFQIVGIGCVKVNGTLYWTQCFGNSSTAAPATNLGEVNKTVVVSTNSSQTITQTPTKKVTATPTPTKRPTATATPIKKPTATATPTKRPTATPVPTKAFTENATVAPTKVATQTPIPTKTPLLTPSVTGAIFDISPTSALELEPNSDVDNGIMDEVTIAPVTGMVEDSDQSTTENDITDVFEETVGKDTTIDSTEEIGAIEGGTTDENGDESWVRIAAICLVVILLAIIVYILFF